MFRVAREAPQALRLSAIYAALDRDGDLGEVTLPHLQAALAVVRFSRECARYIFRGKLIGDSVADRIIQQLRGIGSVPGDGERGHAVASSPRILARRAASAWRCGSPGSPGQCLIAVAR